MSKFKITWPTGKTEEVETADAETVEQFVNIQFGSAWETATESGVTVDLVVGADQEPVAEEPVAEEPVAEEPVAEGQPAE
jgi:hypothetical protein